MATAVSQHVGHQILAAILDFFKNFSFSKTAANFLEISKKYVLSASNKNIIKNGVENKKLEQILSKSYNFLIQTLICIINFA